jgi:hypothetical protein
MFDLLTSFILVLLLGAALVRVLRDFLPKAYPTFLRVAAIVIIFGFFLLSLPGYSGCTLASAFWLILLFPFTPLGLTIVLLVGATWDGRQGGDAKKILNNQVLAALIILVLSSTPVVANWLALQTRQGAAVGLGRGIIDYIPSLQGLSASTSVFNSVFQPLYNPINDCLASPPPPPPPNV